MVPIPKDRKWRRSRSDLRVYLMDRDGMECWFCGLGLGCDSSIEHLIAKSKGGPDIPDNMCLAHEACNNAAGNRDLVAKIKLREEMRRRA